MAQYDIDVLEAESSSEEEGWGGVKRLSRKRGRAAPGTEGERETEGEAEVDQAGLGDLAAQGEARTHSTSRQALEAMT